MKQMRQLYILLFALLLGNQYIHAQVSTKMETFMGKVLTEYKLYFNKAELTENGQLSLSALDDYFMLPVEKKNEIMEYITYQWQGSLVLVHGGTKNELWGRNSENGKTNLIKDWNLNESQPTITQTSEPEKLSRHPCFFYLGGLGMMDSNQNINFALNTRLGFFLLLNRWDLAATYSINFMGTKDSENVTGRTNIGVMSKVYFPIKKYNISPNIGGGISMSSYTDAQKVTTQTVNESLLFGISWFIGFGSLDIGFQTGKEVTTMIGFTIFPRLKTRKK